MKVYSILPLLILTQVYAECSLDECGSPPLMPNYLCFDGSTIAGPGDCIQNSAGQCYWEIITCPTISGYLRTIEASFCMDECSEYLLENESGEYISNVINLNEFELSLYINRYVKIESENDYQCLMCSAMIIDDISLSDECDFPVFCFADPCEVAPECQINTPVECVSNYCGGCHADFYDLEGNLVNCYPETIELCDDLAGVFFGLCDMFLGYAVVNGVCEGVSGCGWESEGTDYSDAFFSSFSECESNCLNEPYLCEDIEYDYDQLHSGIYAECNDNNDCIAVWGACDVGLGGCHYAVNESFYNEDEINNLVSIWLDNDCMEWVCDCASLPNSTCNNGSCQLAYCYDENPAGCFATGCPENYGCIDYEETGDCVPSWCSCDEFYGDWFCTEDCNGGTCFQLGDVNYDSSLNVVDVVSIVNSILSLSDFSSLSDVNSDGSTNILDVIVLVNIILS